MYLKEEAPEVYGKSRKRLKKEDGKSKALCDLSPTAIFPAEKAL